MAYRYQKLQIPTDSKQGNFYEVLQVPRKATTTEIRRSYKRLVLMAHPDKNPGKREWSEKQVKSLLEAFDVLGDPSRRRRYDRELQEKELLLKKATPKKRRKPTEQDLFFFRKNDDEALAMRVLYFLMHQRGKEAIHLVEEIEDRLGDHSLFKHLDLNDCLDCYFLLGEYLIEKKRYFDAFRRLEKAFQEQHSPRLRRPHYSLVLDHLKSLYLRHLPKSLPTTKAVELLEEAPTELFPEAKERARLKVEIARIFHKADDLAQARLNLAEAFELDPGCSQARRFEEELVQAS